MVILLRFINGSRIFVEADDKKILDAGVVIYQGMTFAYKSTTSLSSTPEFVQVKHYTHLD